MSPDLHSTVDGCILKTRQFSDFHDLISNYGFKQNTVSYGDSFVIQDFSKNWERGIEGRGSSIYPRQGTNNYILNYGHTGGVTGSVNLDEVKGSLTGEADNPNQRLFQRKTVIYASIVYPQEKWSLKCGPFQELCRFKVIFIITLSFSLSFSYKCTRSLTEDT